MADLDLVAITDACAGYAACPWDQLESEDQATIVLVVNAAIQEVAVLSGTHIRQRDEVVCVNAPVDMTGCTFTSKSKAWAVGAPAFNASMIGCAIQISGDTFLNRIVSSTELRGPALGVFDGNAKVFGDAIPMPGDFISVLDPVWLNNDQQISPALNDTDRLAAMKECATGDPAFYWIDNRGTVKFIRLWPAPAVDSRISFKGLWGPQTYTAAQMRQTAPAKIIPPVLAGQHELLLLPVILKRLTGWIHFNSQDVKGELQAQYDTAMNALASMNPQRVTAKEYAPDPEAP